MTRRLSNRGDPRGGGDTTGRGQPPKVPCGGRHRPQVRRAGTASHLPAERAHSPPPGCGRAHGYPFRPGHTWNRTPGRAEEEKGGPGRDLARRIRGAPTRPGGEGASERGDGAEPGWPVRPAAAGAAAGGGKCRDPRPPARKAPLSPRCDSAGPNLRRANRVGRIRARARPLSPRDRPTQVPVTFPNWYLWMRWAPGQGTLFQGARGFVWSLLRNLEAVGNPTRTFLQVG